MELEERDALFAASLALVLPDPVFSKADSFEPGVNLTAELVASAGNGFLRDSGHTNNWPYYFVGPEYCGHLFPVVQELWRAAYE